MNKRVEQIVTSLQGLGTSPNQLYTNQKVIDHLKELQSAMARGVFEKTHAENLRDKDIMLHFKTLAEEYGLEQTDTYRRFEANMQDLSYTIGTYIKGMCGERMAKKSLKLLSFDKNIRTLYNVQLEDEDVQAEYDAIVVAPYGLFVVEVKNWDGEVTITPGGSLTKNEGSTLPPEKMLGIKLIPSKTAPAGMSPDSGSQKKQTPARAMSSVPKSICMA